MTKHSLTFLCLATFFVSCGAITEMGKRTEKMYDLSNEIKNNSVCMRQGNTEAMYPQMRSSSASETRDRNFEALLGDDGAQGFAYKLTLAGKYFKAMEHMLYTDIKCLENESDRQELYKQAADEFTRHTTDLYKKIRGRVRRQNGKVRYKNGILALTKTTNGEKSGMVNNLMNYYALAAALHSEHRYQKILEQQGKSLAISSNYKEMIEQALEKEYRNIPRLKYERVLIAGKKRELMVNLLKARVNAITMLALDTMTDADDMSVKQTLRAAADRALNMIGIDRIDLQLDTIMANTNEDAYWEAEQRLEEAAKNKQFLESINERVELDEEVKEIFQGISLQLDRIMQEKSDLGLSAQKVSDLELIQRHLSVLLN